MVPRLYKQSLTLLNAQDGSLRMPNSEANTVKQSLENHIMATNSKECQVLESLNHCSALLKERDLEQDNSPEIVSNSGFTDQDGSFPGCLQSVYWVGDPVQVVDEKIYYASRSINRHVYKVMDHVVICFDNDKLLPLKRQVYESTCSRKFAEESESRSHLVDS